jgi:hypothetical protein
MSTETNEGDIHMDITTRSPHKIELLSDPCALRLRLKAVCIAWINDTVPTLWIAIDVDVLE